jgi:protein-L-isoaspartate(D-aspartate) O-methyltransferase
LLARKSNKAMQTNELLIDCLVKKGVLNTPRIVRAFATMDRKKFVPASSSHHAYIDAPLSIGYGQTISQPSVVAFMLELMDPRAGDEILDIGSGSGWTTALLAECVKPGGRIVGLEMVPELVTFGREHIANASVQNATIQLAKKGTIGLPDCKPFDKILVSAERSTFPTELTPQFTQHLVMPIRGSIYKLSKSGSDGHAFHATEYPGFAFVPLV